MIERLAVDTYALVVWFRAGKPEPSLLSRARHIIVPLPVVGELYTGAFGSAMRDMNVRLIEEFIGRYEVLNPDTRTALLYGQLRATQHLDNIGPSKRNDIWIAALCVQHSLPLLTNDRGFDTIPGLTVIHW
jgi:tRNA(fMet)-specific endonuclease VapC